MQISKLVQQQYIKYCEAMNAVPNDYSKDFFILQAVVRFTRDATEFRDELDDNSEGPGMDHKAWLDEVCNVTPLNS